MKFQRNIFLYQTLSLFLFFPFACWIDLSTLKPENKSANKSHVLEFTKWWKLTKKIYSYLYFFLCWRKRKKREEQIFVRDNIKFIDIKNYILSKKWTKIKIQFKILILKSSWNYKKEKYYNCRSKDYIILRLKSSCIFVRRRK